MHMLKQAAAAAVVAVHPHKCRKLIMLIHTCTHFYPDVSLGHALYVLQFLKVASPIGICTSNSNT